MYDCYRATGWTGALFILSLYLLGNYAVLNLFCALLLSNFEDDQYVFGVILQVLDLLSLHVSALFVLFFFVCSLFPSVSLVLRA
jgi:hypothetical protein